MSESPWRVDAHTVRNDKREEVCEWLREQGGDPNRTLAVAVEGRSEHRVVKCEVRDEPMGDDAMARSHIETYPLRSEPPVGVGEVTV